LDQAVLLELGVGILGTDFAAQAPLSWVRDLLRKRKADVAGGLASDARSWKRIAVAAVAHRQRRVGQAAGLAGALSRGLKPLLRRENLRIASESFGDKVVQLESWLLATRNSNAGERKQCANAQWKTHSPFLSTGILAGECRSKNDLDQEGGIQKIEIRRRVVREGDEVSSRLPCWHSAGWAIRQHISHHGTL
jgi:hypothetical protein